MSFNIALSGIQAINQQLESTSNNIANAGTFGFKSTRANFASTYAGSQATGVQVGSLTQNIGLSGGLLTTNRATDAAISGRGFFIGKDTTGETTYTRVGIFEKSSTDFLIDSTGKKIQGFAVTPPSLVRGALGDIKIPTGIIPAKPSTKIDFVTNLTADWPVPAVAFPTNLPVPPAAAVEPPPDSYNMTKTTLVYDSLGVEHKVNQYFRKGPGLTVQVYVTVDGYQNPTPVVPATLTFDPAGKLDATLTTSQTITINPNPAATLPININYLGSTLQKGDSSTSTNFADGYPAGAYNKLELGEDGSVIAKYSNGESQVVAVLALATFANDDGLDPVNDTSWIATNRSGVADTGAPGEGRAGKLAVGGVEQSNVDITSELVGLMTSQRNYQANSKVIQTENTMLQSLMQAL